MFINWIDFVKHICSIEFMTVKVMTYNDIDGCPVQYCLFFYCLFLHLDWVIKATKITEWLLATTAEPSSCLPLFISCSHCFGETLAHSSLQNCFSSSRFEGIYLCTALLRACHSILMGPQRLELVVLPAALYCGQWCRWSLHTVWGWDL